MERLSQESFQWQNMSPCLVSLCRAKSLERFDQDGRCEYKHIFGPVHSSRLGVSLGLDLLGHQICSYDCVYCEVGATRCLTTKVRPYVHAEDILRELDQWMRKYSMDLDHVTLGGLGEPCLNSEMETIIKEARKIVPHIPIAVLTNSSMLVNPGVRRSLLCADRVLPSMDSLVESEFVALNRPHFSVRLAEVASALLGFRQTYHGALYLEVLLVKGYNDSTENLELLSRYVDDLQPERVDVVTLMRQSVFKDLHFVAPATRDHWQTVLAR